MHSMVGNIAGAFPMVINSSAIEWRWQSRPQGLMSVLMCGTTT